MDFLQLLIFSLFGSNCVIITLFFLNYRAIGAIPENIIRRYQADSRGFQSGSAREKKKLESLIGEDLLENYPLVKIVGEKFPRVAEFVEGRPHLIPTLGAIIGKAYGKVEMAIPEELRDIVAMFVGSVPTKEGD